MGDEKGLYSITELDPSDYESMISIAICEGQRNVVTWAREHGVARDVRNIRNAVCNGDLNMLKWLREIGSPWDGAVIRFAQIYGHRHIEIWARETGCPEPTSLWW